MGFYTRYGAGGVDPEQVGAPVGWSRPNTTSDPTAGLRLFIDQEPGHVVRQLAGRRTPVPFECRRRPTDPTRKLFRAHGCGYTADGLETARDAHTETRAVGAPPDAGGEGKEDAGDTD